jgi:hypothetical protein
MPYLPCYRVAASASKGFHYLRVGRASISWGSYRVVAELLGAGGADRGLLLLVGRASDLSEALPHGGTDGVGVFKHGRVLVRFRSPRWSF